MFMYNLLEYSSNYYMKSGCLWNYFSAEIDDVDDDASESRSY